MNEIKALQARAVMETARTLSALVRDSLYSRPSLSPLEQSLQRQALRLETAAADLAAALGQPVWVAGDIVFARIVFAARISDNARIAFMPVKLLARTLTPASGGDPGWTTDCGWFIDAELMRSVSITDAQLEILKAEDRLRSS